MERLDQLKATLARIGSRLKDRDKYPSGSKIREYEKGKRDGICLALAYLEEDRLRQMASDSEDMEKIRFLARKFEEITDGKVYDFLELLEAMGGLSALAEEVKIRTNV